MSEDKQLPLDRLTAVIRSYLEGNLDRDMPVTYHLHPDRLREGLDLSLPPDGSGWEGVFRAVDEYLKYSVRTGHPQFFNQLWSGFSAPGFLGEVITSLANTSMYTYEAAPVATLLEKELIERMGRLAGFDDPEGLFMTGGSNGNLIAMLIARNRALPDIKRIGFPAANRLKAFVSDQSHYSFEKAANLLGLGEAGIVKVPTDPAGRMLPGKLAEAVRDSRSKGEIPFFVGATAGTTVKGAFDSCRGIGPIARREDLWFHVDGSFGGSVLLSPRHRGLLDGLEEADSFVWNPHKMLGVPLICSLILLKEKGHLRRTNATGGTEYIFHDEAFGAFDLGPDSLQCGRRVDALKLWLEWKYRGEVGFARRIERLFELAGHAEAQVKTRPGLEMMAPRTSLCVCFRSIPPEGISSDTFNLALREALARNGSTLVNYAYLDGAVTLRPVIVNPDLSRSEIERFFDRVTAAAKILHV